MAEKKAPTVASQIRDAKAPKGSRLESLIRENQELDLLAADEIDDEYPLPLWLRVFWRRQHPEVELPERNPGAAYPEVLSQMYRRMVANPELPWGVDPGDDPPR